MYQHSGQHLHLFSKVNLFLDCLHITQPLLILHNNTHRKKLTTKLIAWVQCILITGNVIQVMYLLKQLYLQMQNVKSNTSICLSSKTHLLTMVYERIYQTRYSKNPANYCTDTGNKVCKRLVLFSVLNLHTDKPKRWYGTIKRHATNMPLSSKANSRLMCKCNAMLES